MQYENPSFGPASHASNSGGATPAHQATRITIPTDTQPRDVPGYQDAVNAGIVKLPPLQPPTVLATPSASRMAPFILAVTVVIALIGVTSHPNLAATVGFIVIITAWWRYAGRWVERRIEDELAAGYITVPVVHLRNPNSAANSGRPGWDYAGTWRMNRAGQVNAAPDRHHDAPGFYPSPVRPVELQLWTGSMWLPTFRAIPAGQAHYRS